MTISKTCKTFFLVAAFGCALVGRLAPVSGATPRIMPVAEVKPGMTGYGLTTLSGADPKRFHAEVLGVIQGWYPRSHAVLVRLSSPEIDQTGVAAGMSGSPIYIEDRLLGAIAFGFYYAKIPLAGVTPAEEMLQVQAIDRQAAGQRHIRAKQAARSELDGRLQRLARLATPGRADGPSEERLRRAALELIAPPLPLGPRPGIRLPSAFGGLPPDGPRGELQPLPIPMAVSGLGAECMSLLTALHGSGFVAVQGASGVAVETDPRFKPEPGSPIGAVLISGDMDISAMGTVTWVEDDTVMAYGHPLFGFGDTDYPMAVGSVQAVVPSTRFSFRLSAADKIVGRIVQDRDSAILGKLGEAAPMFPCKATIKGTVPEEYNYRIAGHWQTAPMLAFIAAYDSGARWEGQGNPVTLKVRAEIFLSGHNEPLVLQNHYAATNLFWAGFELVGMPLMQLMLNPYEEVRIDRLNYELEVTQGYQLARIESAWMDRVQAEPGSEVTVYVRLEEYRGEKMTRKLRLQVPESAVPGTEAGILVCDAETSRRVKGDIDPGFYSPENFENMLALLQDMESNKNLVMRASFVERGVRYAGEAMEGLPASAINILQSDNSGGRVAPLVTDMVQSVETPWVLRGGQFLSLTIKEPSPYNP